MDIPTHINVQCCFVEAMWYNDKLLLCHYARSQISIRGWKLKDLHVKHKTYENVHNLIINEPTPPHMCIQYKGSDYVFESVFVKSSKWSKFSDNALYIRTSENVLGNWQTTSDVRKRIFSTLAAWIH